MTTELNIREQQMKEALLLSGNMLALQKCRMVEEQKSYRSTEKRAILQPRIDAITRTLEKIQAALEAQ